MSDRLKASLLPHLLPQSQSCAPISATGLVWLSEGALTAKAGETALVEQQHDVVSPQRQIALAPQARVMHFDTDALAMGTDGSLIGANHFHFYAAVPLHLLTQNPKFGQILGGPQSLPA